MIAEMKTFARKVVAALNIAAIVLMLAVGYSDHINPVEHPFLATAGLAFPVLLIVNVCFLFFWLMFNRRMAFLPLLGFVVCYGPVRNYIPFNIPHDTPIGCIKVLSFNVHGYAYTLGDDNASGRITDYIRRSKADIVCLQEDNDQSQDPHAQLDSIYPYSRRIKLGNANAIGVYSRFPIVRSMQIDYESKANGSMACWLDVNGKTVIVVNNHFESNHLSYDDKSRYKNLIKGNLETDTAKKETRYLADKLGEASRQRAPQAQAVADFIESHKEHPVILCGDFNESPISYTHHLLTRRLTDCFTATANGPGLSYNQKGFNVRIDNILCSSHFTPFNCRVDNKIHASDHYPIYCWLKFSYKP